MTDRAQQQEIIEALEVPQDFDLEAEVERRIAFLAGYLQTTGAKGYVLGISGGVDSSTAGRLAQLACERVRSEGGDATFIAIRLPYHVQKDEDDAQRALKFIRADEQTAINIGPATDAMWEQVMASDATPDESVLTDFVKGNVKARQRMIAQYTVAGARGMLVIGTDQGAEAIVGFFTKFGDGAADLLPLAGMPKRRVREIAAHLGAEDATVNKVPTADLETDRPLLPDEQALGVRYEDVDDYLEGRDVPAEAEATILDVIADPEDVIAGSDVIGDARSLSDGSEATWPVEPLALLAMSRTAESVRMTMTTTARVEGGGGLTYEALSGRVCFTIEVRADSPVELLSSDCRGDDGRVPDHIAEGEEAIVPLSELELTRS